MTAKIVVACGSGVATSEMVAVKIAKLLEDAGIQANVKAVELEHAERELLDACAFVPVVKSNKTYSVPVINGAAFLTGMNQEQALRELIALIQNAQ